MVGNMKQKIILLMVLLAGFTACSKDDGDDDVSAAYELKADILMGIGEYEGDWILNNKQIEKDTLTVLEHSLIVKFPSERLLRYVVGTIPSALDEVRFEYSNSYHCFDYELQGNSENKSYSNLYDASSSSPYMKQTVYSVANGTMYYNGGIDEEIKHGYYSVLTDVPMLAIYDKVMHLWTLKITVNKLTILKDGDTNEIITDLSSPVELLFVTTKKIKKN